MLDDGFRLLIMAAVMLAAVLLANHIIDVMWPIHPPHQQSPSVFLDIESGNPPEAADPELAHEWLNIYTMSDINLPPATHLGPSDTFPDIDNSQSPPSKAYGVMPVALNDISMSDL
jgi:hypothetical protein